MVSCGRLSVRDKQIWWDLAFTSQTRQKIHPGLSICLVYVSTLFKEFGLTDRYSLKHVVGFEVG